METGIKMSNVYFKKIDSEVKPEDISTIARELLEKVIAEENFTFEKEVPIKVHFGEKGNHTFVKPENYQGIIDYLKENNIESTYVETNVLYKGERTRSDSHTKLALEHGFTQLPITIADGYMGEEFDRIVINKKHFDSCKIASGFKKWKQFIVTSHFKGHQLGGFGAALKQLAMGFAARGGKLDQHSNAHPFINPFKCKRCWFCRNECPVDAISIGRIIKKIDHKKCIGCAACIAVCPHDAMSINWMGAVGKKFREKMAEYALAAVQGKKNIYITFAMDITDKCDCVGEKMKTIAPNIGIFASTDPVSIDVAAMDMTDKVVGKSLFKGRHIIEYSAKIGVGEKEYNLIEL